MAAVAGLIKPTRRALVTCPEAKTFLRRAPGRPSEMRRKRADTLIRTLLREGIWPKLDILAIEANYEDATSRLNWKGDSFTLTPVSSPSFLRDRGWVSNGTSSYLDTGYAPGVSAGVAAQNDFCMGIWYNTGNTSNALDAGNTNCSINGIANLSAWSARCMNVTPLAFSSTLALSGEYSLCINRVAAGNYQGYVNGVLDGSQTQASAAPVSASIFIGARNNAGTPVSWVARRERALWAGAALTAGQIAAMHAALRVWMTGVGAA